MSKPTNKEILDSIQRTYILSEALNSELIWLKSYCKPEYVKIINEAKAKVNHLKVTIASDTSKEALAEYEEIAFTFHEKVMDVINPKPKVFVEDCGNRVECYGCGDFHHKSEMTLVTDEYFCKECIPNDFYSK